MKRIKQEEARQYVLASDIYEAKYFFTAPSTDPEYPAKEGWEDVKYFSRKNTVITQSGEGDTHTIGGDMGVGLDITETEFDRLRESFE